MYSPMKIALVMHGWPPQEFGGVGLYVQALAYALQEQGHDVTIFVPNHEYEEQDFAWGTLRSITFPVARTWKETWFRAKKEIERQEEE